MLIDLHAHTSGISRCCKIDASGMLEAAKNVGLDGVALTNHYQKSYLKHIEGGNPKTFAQKYIDEFYRTNELGESVGMRVLFGIEVTSEPNEQKHILVYGVEPEFVLDHPCIFDYSLKELYETVKSVGGIIVQAHPYRKGGTLLDVKYLDGVEVNCHPLYGKSDAEAMIAIATENHLVLTCGGDYHNDTYRCKCGMYLPDNVTDGIALGKYIASANEVKLCIHEPYGDIYDFEFKRIRK